MKNRTRRLFGLLLVFSILLSLFSGCTNSAQEEKKSIGRETYDSATSFTFDYTGPTEPTVPVEEESSEGVFQTFSDTTFAESQSSFEPLSDEELSQLADEVREEIEESYQLNENNPGEVTNEQAPETAGEAANDQAPEGVGAASNQPRQLTIEDIQERP